MMSVAMYRCRVLAQKGLEDIAFQFDVGHCAMGSVRTMRLKDGLETDAKLARRLRELEERLR